MRRSLALAGLLALAACDEGYDNVEKCEAFVATLSCGDVDTTGLLDCSVYEAVKTCDVQPYFDCLAEHTTCDETSVPVLLDTSTWPECADLAACP